MATDRVEAFLGAEEEANRLVDELMRLKEEAESYRTAREAVNKAAEGVSVLTTQLGTIAGQLGEVVETMRSIGTPELLRAQEASTREIAALRQDLGGREQSIAAVITQAMGEFQALREKLEAAEQIRQQRDEANRQTVQALKEDLGAQLASVHGVASTVRNLAFGTVGLLLINLLLIGWLALSLGR